MSETPFTQARANEIVAGINQHDVDAFVGALALPDGLLPLPEVVANVSWPADAHIDASTFVSHGPRATASVTSNGHATNVNLVMQNGQWKVAPLGSYEDVTQPSS